MKYFIPWIIVSKCDDGFHFYSDGLCTDRAVARMEAKRISAEVGVHCFAIPVRHLTAETKTLTITWDFD